MIPYVREMRFEYGVADQVSPLIRRVLADNPGPFTYLGTGTYIVGHGEVAVIDPGPDLPDHLDAILAATRGERVTAILVTHNHADHSPLADPLARLTGAPTYGCPMRSRPVETEVKMEADHDVGFVAQNSVCGGDQIAGPGWTFEAIPTPGHTSNHVCYALAEENALFSGDHVMGWSTTVVTPPDGDMGQYLASLRLIRARGFETIWPTHGPPIREVDPFLAAYEAHRLERERQVLDQLAAGPATIGQMVPVIYAAVDPRLHPAAAHSMLAHLIQLAREGRVLTDGEPGLGSVFRLA
ncbi:MAG: fold metallo-hydrolase [Caulobacteraceae bacterium]|nr:fold metallo-hydrolase [Caulobacteraceae bacterium]